MTRLCGVLAAAMVVHAAAGAAEPALMATVEIVATAPIAGLGIERKLLPYAVQSATGERIGEAHTANLADYLARNFNGVNVNEISGSPFQNDITYRGFRASPVLGTAQGISVYLDGVRVNEPFGDVVNWDMLPEAALANVQLVPGSNPVYGLNTLGGALALAGKSGASHPGMEAELSLTDAGRRRFDLAFGAGHANGWHNFIGATLFDDDGWRDHSQGKLGNVYVKIGASSWSVALLGGRSRLRGNGLLPDAMAEQDRRASYTFPDETRNRLLQITLNASQRLDAATEVSALAYARSSRRDTVNGDVEDGPVGVFNTTSTRQHGQGASALLGMRRAQHRIEIGATFDRSSVSFAQFGQDGILTDTREIRPDPDAQREPASSVIGSARAAGVFASDTWKLGPGLHVTASGRYNHAKVGNTLTSERGVQPHEQFTYKRFNPALGVAYDAGGGWTLAANAAQGNRVPTVIELGCADPEQPCQLPVGLQSDPYLKQVVARTVEAGARYQDGTTSASASLYRTANRDDILFLSSGLSRQGYFSNFERTRHQGLDFSARGTAGRATLSLSYNYLAATYDAPGVLFTGVRTVQVERGTRIAGLPRHTVKLGAQWKMTDALTLGADAQAFSSMGTQGNEDGLLADMRIRGYGLLSLRASWEAAPGWELTARVNNVFDRRYASFGAVGRNLFGGDGQEGDSRFVAPGAPRMFAFGARYRF
jgi:outer membrane receptor protein involved in Fe transport